jgi:glycosyltransferase involved in cell wall biosynthesis
MNILVIRESNVFLTSSASNNRFLSLAKGLVENGCNIDLIFLRGFSGKREKELFKKSGNIDGMNYLYSSPYYMPFIYVQKVLNRFIYTNYRYNIQIIKQILRKKKYDYIWLHSGENIIKIGLGLKKSSVNISFFHEQSEFSFASVLANKKKIQEKYLNEFLPIIDIFSIMTVTLINYYKNYVGVNTKIIHVPMTVDFSRFKQNDSDDQSVKSYIGYCGTMSNKKDGVIILIKSFVEIMNIFPEISLYIAGNEEPKDDYQIQKEYILKNNAENRIKYIGPVSKEEMPDFLSKAKVLALARPKSKQAEGGFPTKLGEYLATGNPVCVTRVGEIENYLKDGESAFMADPDSVNSFAEALKRALTDNNANVIGRAGRKVAFENFNKDIQSKKLYEFLLQNRKKSI